MSCILGPTLRRSVAPAKGRRGCRSMVRVDATYAVLLSELIHRHVRFASETAVHEERRAARRATRYERSEDAALILLFSLVASGQITLRRIDGWRKIAAMLRQHTVAA